MKCIKLLNGFESDSMDLALNGNGANYGFLDIIDEYGSTPAGNSAHYYAGYSYYSKGDYYNTVVELWYILPPTQLLLPWPKV